MPSGSAAMALTEIEKQAIAAGRIGWGPDRNLKMEYGRGALRSD
jgi:hypothetical protein